MHVLTNEQINTNTSYRLGTETVDRMPGVLFMRVNELTDSSVQGGFCDVEKEEEGRKIKGIKVMLESRVDKAPALPRQQEALGAS